MREGTVNSDDGKRKIVACIPAYNEEKTIARVILETEPYVDAILVCDDGSSDMTGNIAKRLGAVVIRHRRNLGKGAALRTLFKKARQFSPHVVVTLDADGQHNPNEIPSVVKPILDQGYDVVVGSRLKSKSMRNLIPWHRRVGNIALTRMTEAGQPHAILDTQSGFRAYGKEALLMLTPTEQGMGVDSELIMKARQENLRIVELQATVRYDVPKPSKRNSIRHALDSVISILKFISTRHPMIFYGGPGLSSLAVGLTSGVYVVHFYQTEGFVPLGPTLLAVGATVTGLLFLFTGIILFTLINVLRERG